MFFFFFSVCTSLVFLKYFSRCCRLCDNAWISFYFVSLACDSFWQGAGDISASIMGYDTNENREVNVVACNLRQKLLIKLWNDLLPHNNFFYPRIVLCFENSVISQYMTCLDWCVIRENVKNSGLSTFESSPQLLLDYSIVGVRFSSTGWFGRNGR